jgi:prepilin-type N-terminal cleavage/methylation domain-containing protein
MRYSRINLLNNIETFKNEEGLTLIELMIVLVLSLILMAAAYMSYQIQSTSSQTQSQVSLMQQDLRAAMYNLSKDIRNAGCETKAVISAAEVPNLVATSNSSGVNRLTLYMDITGTGGNPDGDTNDPGEHVLYRLQGTDLQRIDFNDNNSTMQIAQNVQAFQLTYYSYNSATNTFSVILAAALPGNEANVRLVKISMTTRSSQPDPDSGQYLTRTLDRRIKLRNIIE